MENELLDLQFLRKRATPETSRAAVRRQNAVTVRGACKHYGTKKEPIIVLENLNMTVPKGIIYGLLGASGCGKTTLLNCIIGRKYLNSGALRVLDGTPGSRGSGVPGTRIGYMPQDTALYNEFSIEETMKYFGWIAGMSTKHIYERLRYLKHLLLLPDVSKKVKYLSGGQKRRISFAAALLHEPELLILDEPTVGLDPVLREKIWAYLKEITKNHSTTVILTTHYIDETRQAHIIGLMRGGYIVAEETPSGLLSRFHTTTLEDVFLKLSLLQNRGRRRRSSAVQAVSDAVKIPNEVLKELVIVEHVESESGDISAEFGDSVSARKGARRFSLINSEEIPEFPPKTGRSFKITDYLLYMKANHMKALLWKNFLWLLRNWIVMISIIGLPVTQIAMFFWTVGHAPKYLDIGLVNHETNISDCEPLACDSLRLSCNYLEYLKEKTLTFIRYESEEEAKDLVKEGKISAVIMFKQNYTAALKARIRKWPKADEADYLYSTIDVFRDVTVKDIASYVKVYLYDTIVQFMGDYLESCHKNRKKLSVPIKWEKPVYGIDRPEFTEFASPGVVITIAFYLSAALTGITMLVERNEGILERSLVMGVNPTELLISHIVSEYFIMNIQILATMACALCGFQMYMVGPLGVLLSLVLFAGFCGMCFGFSLSATCDTESTAIYLLSGTFIPTVTLSGIIWPTEGMDFYVRKLAYFLPLTYPSESFRSIMQRGWGLSHPTVYWGFITLTAWSVIFLIISVVFLKLKKK